MSNSNVLKFGNRKAKEMIRRHVLNQILVPLANELIVWATNHRVGLGHNMTGNTVNAYAAGVFVDGHLCYVRGSWEDIPSPVHPKLGLGQKFYTGWQRWEGSIQEHTFKAAVATNGTTEPERCIAFIKGYQSNVKWEIVICNGVEYATFQEQIMNIDTLSQSYTYSQSTISSILNNIPQLQ